MKADTVLDYAVFQLTPTRTRCELLISSKGVTEKLASGLLKPFLSHLRAAEEQLAVGGYSIKLEPPTDGPQNEAAWFTKGTMQRFVRFVSTPEVLERVTAVESELLRLEEELNAYSHEGYEHHAAVDPTANGSGGKKSGTPGKFRKDVTEDVDPEPNETSRSRLLKATEARQSMLQREQGMAFARAIAAGFDADHLPNLIAFADNFGATRLREACLRFTALCKKQQESGLWLDEMELVAAEGALPYSDTNGAGITIAPGMDTFASSKDEEDDSTSIKCVDDVGKGHPGDNHHQRTDRQADHPTYPPMIGMLPGQMPPYPWMQFGSDQAFDPRYFPAQNMAVPPFGNGGYPPMGPYWSQDSWRGHPSPGGAHNAQNVHEEEEDEDEPVEKTISKKSGRKSSPRRRTSPGKKVQVGRSGKRSGMVLIRNINYITSQQDGNKSKSTGSERNDSEDVSDAVSGSDEQGQSEYDRKKANHKNLSSTEASSEEASRSEGKGNTYADVFVMPERTTAHPGAGVSFENEAFSSQQGKQQPSSTDESFLLETGRSYASSGGHYDFDDQMVSAGRRQRVSEDGLLLPQRIHGHQSSSSSHHSELALSAGKVLQAEHEKQGVDDSFIIPQRGDQAEVVQPSSEVVFENGNGGAHDSRMGSSFDEFFIVPTRSNPEGVGDSARRTLELDEQLYAEPKEKLESKASKVEPDDIWMLPERSTGKESLEKRWRDVDYDMEAMSSLQNKPAEEEDNNDFYDQYHEQRDAKLMKESGSKKAEREAKLKSLQENLEKRKAEIGPRVKPTRSSILKSKKDREEEERKRIEELAAQRRNRIAARTGGTTAASRTSSATVRRSLSSTSGNKVPSASSTRNPLARSVPSLTALKKENAKPSAAKPTPSRSPLPTTDDKKRETLRKSIASVRELKKKPETPADKPVLRKSSTITGSAALNGIGAAA